MLSILLALATSARAVVADPSQSPPPPVPAQLAFGPPQRAHSSPGALVSFTWQDRAAFQRATQLFDDDDLDVWFAGRRSTVGARDPHWEAVVRFDDDLAQDDSVSRLVARVEPDAAQGLPPSALADHLSSPSGSTSYARALSAAVLANLSAAPLETLSTGAIHDTYHPYDGIRDILASLEEAHPEWVKVVSLGKSSQGRDIWAVKVTNQTAPAHEGSTVAGQDDDEESEDEDGDEDVSDGPLPFVVSSSSSKRHRHKRGRKLGFVIAGTQHAREWIAASTLIYLVHDLVAPNDKGKTTHHKLLNSVEFTFVPVVNVRSSPSLSLASGHSSCAADTGNPLATFTARRLRLLVGHGPSLAQVSPTRRLPLLPLLLLLVVVGQAPQSVLRHRPQPQLGLRVPARRAPQPLQRQLPGPRAVRVGRAAGAEGLPRRRAQRCRCVLRRALVRADACVTLSPSFARAMPDRHELPPRSALPLLVLVQRQDGRRGEPLRGGPPGGKGAPGRPRPAIRDGQRVRDQLDESGYEPRLDVCVARVVLSTFLSLSLSRVDSLVLTARAHKQTRAPRSAGRLAPSCATEASLVRPSAALPADPRGDD